jgi:uncharacterized protein (TIGR03032 family)
VSAAEGDTTAVNYEHTAGFVGLLESLGVSLLVSTYQAGKLLTVGTHQGKIALSFHNFEQAMGVAVKPGVIAVGTRRQVWFLRSAPDIAAQVEPAGQHDACYLTRAAHFTGLIHGHEMAWTGEQLWVVNTLFSCLCTLEPGYSFVPRWRPPFISALAAEDRCHLNGLALEAGRPRYLTALAESDTAAGWRPTKATSGCLIDVPGGRTVARGFAMPHSPRVHDGRVWLLDSGRGRLTLVEPVNGRAEPVAHVQGYARGLALYGPYAFVGLSRIRETSVFGGLPIAEQRQQLRCGVAVVDVRSGRVVAGLTFHSGVEEIFDVQVLPGVRCPAVSGPLPDVDGRQTLWLAPQLKQSPRLGVEAKPQPGRAAQEFPGAPALPSVPPLATLAGRGYEEKAQ